MSHTIDVVYETGGIKESAISWMCGLNGEDRIV